ncbi:MAG: polysaccharide biosynthesis tyrosine autokinase, partial [Bdellovibrionales bacterium]|nr:polysaccharide biosynthesis tyrosine autokinase [Bdellovibrionales bacterium]
KGSRDKREPQENKRAEYHAPARSASAHPGSYYGYGYSYSSIHSEKPLQEYIGVIFRYKLLILILSLLGLGVGKYLSDKAPILYTASGMVNIGEYVPPTDGPTADALRSETTSPDYIYTLLPLLRSYAIAREALRSNEDIIAYLDPDLAETRAKASKAIEDTRDFPVTTLDAYLSHVSFDHISDTSLVRIVATATTADWAAKLANAHANAFITLVREQRTIAAQVNVDFLEKRVVEAIDAAAQSEAALIEYANEHSIAVTDANTTATANAQKFQSIISGLSQAIVERTQYEGELRELRRSTDVRDMKMDSQGWSLLSKLIELEADEQDLRRRNSSHPQLPVVRAQIQRLKNLLRANARTAIRDSEIRSNAAYQKQNLLEDELKRLRDQDGAQASARLGYTLLERKNDAAKELVQKIQKRLDDARINAASDQKTIRLIDPAVPPSMPNTSKKFATLMSGLLFGALLGIALAFIFDYHDTAIRGLSDLSEAVHAPVLGLIPWFSRELILRRSESSADSEKRTVQIIETSDEMPDPMIDHSQALRSDSSGPQGIVLLAAPMSRESEAFRNLRTTIKLSMHDGPPKSLLVTSAQKGDGKTTIAANLAASLSQTGARTLLIDADLRMPTIHTHFGFDRETEGMVDYLGDLSVARPNILPSGIHNLSLLLAGSYTEIPAELLGSRRMLELLDHLGENYEHIIIDTPPVGEIADALLLSRTVDGVVFAVRANKTPKPAVQHAMERLHQVRARIIGCTLNGLRAKHSYYKSYGSYGYAPYSSGPHGLLK